MDEKRVMQALALTPQLQRAIRLLECDRRELEEIVEQELADNPALERVSAAEPGEPEVVATVGDGVELPRGSGLRVRQEAASIMTPGAVRAPATDEQTRDAEWLIRSLARRDEIVRQVVELALARHTAFFAGSTAEVAPIPLGEAAEALGLHESTLRRVVSNKAVRCVHGVTHLSRLFR